MSCYLGEVVWSCGPQTFFVLLITAPLTSSQFICSSISSSINPQSTTLSPLIMYSPCLATELCIGSPRGRMIRSWVSLRTRLASLSVDTRTPAIVRPSTEITTTFSTRTHEHNQFERQANIPTVDVRIQEGHVEPFVQAFERV